jgi:hypothetical protein
MHEPMIASEVHPHSQAVGSRRIEHEFLRAGVDDGKYELMTDSRRSEFLYRAYIARRPARTASLSGHSNTPVETALSIFIG